MLDPSTNGRKRNGTFDAGNSLGRGNPYAAQVARLRSVMLKSVTEKSMRAIINKLVSLAEAGDLGAIKILISYIGKPPELPAVAIQVVNHGIESDDDSKREKTLALIRRIQHSGDSPSPSGPPSPAVQALLDMMAARRATEASADDD